MPKNKRVCLTCAVYCRSSEQPSLPRTVALQEGENGFGFILRGAKGKQRDLYSCMVYMHHGFFC